tara:strand:- start:739 stop:966 length:228 start_codon:yes stop_codon:yes gene_type:complete
MKKFLIQKGIVKTEQQANYVLIAIIILCFIFIFYKLSGNTSPRTINTVDDSEFMDDGMLPGELDANTEAELELLQ